MDASCFWSSSFVSYFFVIKQRSVRSSLHRHREPKSKRRRSSGDSLRLCCERFFNCWSLVFGLCQRPKTKGRKPYFSLVQRAGEPCRIHLQQRHDVLAFHPLLNRAHIFIL